MKTNLIKEIENIMKKMESLTSDFKSPLTRIDYYIEDLGCPHVPSKLPKGYCAVYMFIYIKSDNSYEFLKIGKANSKSSARFTSQHYYLKSPSTLAKSICNDKEFIKLGINEDNVRDWMLNNLYRVNILIKKKEDNSASELIESVLHYAFKPRFEGNI